MDNHKTLTIFGGVNGAGKSSLAEELRDKSFEYINPDLVYKGIADANPELSYEAGWRVTARTISEKFDSKFAKGESFSFETTFAGNTATKRIIDAREKGYKIRIHFVALDSLQKHHERVEYRVKTGGHPIKPEDIDRRFKTVYEKFPDILAAADRATVWDNSTLNAYEKVLEVEKGKITYLDKDKMPQPVRDALKETKLEIGQKVQSNFEEKEVKFMNMKTFEESTRKVRMQKGLTPEQREGFARENVIAKDDRLSKVNSKDLRICFKEVKSLNQRKGLDLSKG